MSHAPSQKEIDAARTPDGGWTRDTLAGWGIPWPVPTGWRHRLLAEYLDEHRADPPSDPSRPAGPPSDERVPRALVVLAKASAATLGALVTSTLSIHGGDPAMAAAAGETLALVATDYLDRQLSPVEKEQGAEVLVLAAIEIERRLSHGEELRSDGLFDPGNEQGQEIVRGVVFSARDEYQKRKLPYMANLIASFAFRSDISPTTASVVLREAESLTWLDLCLLSMVRRPQEFPLPVADVRPMGPDFEEWAITESLARLSGTYTRSPYDESWPGPKYEEWDVRDHSLQLTTRGLLMTDLMGLEAIPVRDVLAPWRVLRGIVEAREDSNSKSPAGAPPEDLTVHHEPERFWARM